MVLVAGGVPVTVTGVWALAPMNGVTVYAGERAAAVAGRGPAHLARSRAPAVAVTPVGATGAAAGPLENTTSTQ